MSQTWDVDTIVQTGTSPAVDIQKIIDGLDTLRSVFSGATEPVAADRVANMLWKDTTTGLLKQRNAGDTAWVVVAPTPAAQTATGGTSQAYTLTPSPAIESYSAAMRLRVQMTIGPGFAPTVNVSGLGVRNLKFLDITGAKKALHYLAAPTGWVADLAYDGTDVVMLQTARRNALAQTDKAIFGYGFTTVNVSMTNLVSNLGVVASDTTGVGTARVGLAAAGYGGDKAIFGYGHTGAAVSSLTNLSSNLGVVATDVTGVGTARYILAAAGYGGDKALFGYGTTGAAVSSMTNLVSNLGVVASDTAGIGAAREQPAAAGYGGDKAIFGYGFTTVNVSMTNLVSNLGVVSADTTGVGTARYYLAAAGYGGDKAIFGYGFTTVNVSMTNLVSNLGVVASDTTGVGTARVGLAAAGYGGDKAIFGYGDNGAVSSLTNLVSNVGVVASDVTGVGTARVAVAAAGYSLA